MAWPAIISAVASVMGTVAQQQGNRQAREHSERQSFQEEARKRRDKGYEMQRANISERGESQQQGTSLLLNSLNRALKR